MTIIFAFPINHTIPSFVINLCLFILPFTTSCIYTCVIEYGQQNQMISLILFWYGA